MGIKHAWYANVNCTFILIPWSLYIATVEWISWTTDSCSCILVHALWIEDSREASQSSPSTKSSMLWAKACPLDDLPHAHVQKRKVISRVVIVGVIVSTKIVISWDLSTCISISNQLNLAKNWLQYVSNRGTRSTSVRNSDYCLAIVAMLMDAYSMHNAYRQACALCSCAQLVSGLVYVL